MFLVKAQIEEGLEKSLFLLFQHFCFEELFWPRALSASGQG
jgi:hypothetical protein